MNTFLCYDLFYIWIIFAILYLYYFIVKIDKPNIKRIETVDSITPMLESGDVLLVSWYDNFSKKSGYNTHFIRNLFGNGNWTHVAIIVIINNEPFVYDTFMHNPNWEEYDITFNPRKDSGFLSLSKYVENLNGYVAIRKLKKNYNKDRGIFLDIMLVHNNLMSYTLDKLRILKSYFYRKDIKTVDYNYSCAEAIAFIYTDAGISHKKFHAGVTLYPFIEDDSDIFDDIIHIKPGPKCIESVSKHFNNF
jgi:hypothetical protein